MADADNETAEETFEVDEQGVAYSSESAPSADAPLKPATIAPAAATGRRKEAVARVRIVPGSGKWTVNGRDLDSYKAQVCDRHRLAAGRLCIGRHAPAQDDDRRRDYDEHDPVLGQPGRYRHRPDAGDRHVIRRPGQCDCWKPADDD